MTTVVVDPRLRARRIEVLRAEGRRRLRWVVVVFTLIGIGVVTLVALRSPLFDVDRITVSGAERTSTSAITAAADLDLDEPLVEVDLGAIAARVEELPWIDE
ncbi:MAG: FtsQ-type POTRA domain-containing protein, partial [Actinomycetota bacterium]